MLCMIGLVAVIVFVIANALVAPILGRVLRGQSVKEWWLS